jgi:hypothetical protein
MGGHDKDWYQAFHKQVRTRAMGTTKQWTSKQDYMKEVFQNLTATLECLQGTASWNYYHLSYKARTGVAQSV